MTIEEIKAANDVVLEIMETLQKLQSAERSFVINAVQNINYMIQEKERAALWGNPAGAPSFAIPPSPL